jgi:hypothetical protein
MECILGVAEPTTEIASRQSDKNTGETGMHGFALKTVKDFIDFQFHNSTFDPMNEYTNGDFDSKHPI